MSPIQTDANPFISLQSQGRLWAIPPHEYNNPLPQDNCVNVPTSMPGIKTDPSICSSIHSLIQQI